MGSDVGREKNGEMQSTITLVISGRTKIYDIDMLLIVWTSSLFNNVMQTVHELMTLLPLHWATITLHLDLVYVVILLMLFLLKKVLHGSTMSYICACQLTHCQGFGFISLNQIVELILSVFG